MRSVNGRSSEVAAQHSARVVHLRVLRNRLVATLERLHVISCGFKRLLSNGSSCTAYAPGLRLNTEDIATVGAVQVESS
jgi:hypothetical protein